MVITAITRVPGAFHDTTTACNDVEQYVFDVEHSELLAQAGSWGLAGLQLEQLDLSSTMASRLPAVLDAVLPVPAARLPAVDARAAAGYFSYPADHVLPYVASALSVLPRDTVIAYVGANRQLAARISAVIDRLGFRPSLQVVPTGAGFEDPIDGTRIVAQVEITRDAEAVIVDFGLPTKSAAVAPPTRISHWALEDRLALDRTLEVFDQLTQLDAGEELGAKPLRSYIVVNAVYNVIEDVADTRLDRGREAVRDPDPPRSRAGRRSEDMAPLPQLGIGGRSAPGASRYEFGDPIDLTTTACKRHLEGDWGLLTSNGVWTDGRRSGFVLDIDPDELRNLEGAIFTTRIDQACDPRRRETRIVDVEVAGERVARRHFANGAVDGALYRAMVSGAVLRRERPIQVDLLVQEPSVAGRAI